MASLLDSLINQVTGQASSTTTSTVQPASELTTEVLNRIEAAILEVLGASGILAPGASFFHSRGAEIASYIVNNINSVLVKHDVTFTDLQGAAKLVNVTFPTPPSSDPPSFGRALFAMKDAIPKLPPIGPSATLGGTSTGATTFTPLSVPTGQFLKLRFANTQWAGTPVVGPQSQPDQELVNSVNLATGETNVSYRWEGFINFDAAPYDFTAFVTNGLRVTVAGDKVIDDVVLSAQRGITQRKTMPAGATLVIVDWFNPSGNGSVNLNITKVAAQSWKSCADGVTRDGAPPTGWTLTTDGCWKAPLDSSAANTGLDLAKVVQLAPDASVKIERAYLLGSGLAQDPYHLRFFNCSTNMAVQVELTGPDVLSFVTAFQTVGDVGVGGLPANKFTLDPRREMLVDVAFRTDRMEALPEGLNSSQIFVKLTAGRITIPTGGDGQIQVGLCEGLTPPPTPTSSIAVPQPQILPPAPSWADCSSGTRVSRSGLPPAGWTLRSDGCYIPPAASTPTVALDFSFSQLPTTTQVISGLLGGVGGLPILHGTMNGLLTGDDPTTYKYSWNFDVAGQGAGTGQASVQTPTNVAWAASAADQVALRNGGIVTRTVEVVATKGTTVLRARKQVSFRGTVSSPTIVPTVLPLTGGITFARPQLL